MRIITKCPKDYLTALEIYFLHAKNVFIIASIKKFKERPPKTTCFVHYGNMPICPCNIQKYYSYKNENFHQKKKIFFLFLLKPYIVGTR